MSNKKLILLISLLFTLLCGMLVFIFWDPIIDWLPIDQSGWEEMKTGGICYLDEDGDPIPGWLEIESNIYYFDPQSYAMQTGWIELSGERFYLGTDGIRRTGWQTIDGKRYYLNENGVMLTGWLEQPEGFLYLNENGNPQSGWLELEEGKYYLNENSIRQYGWLELDGKRYYLDETGIMLTGWLEQEEGKYYLGSDGTPMNGWQIIDDQIYFLSEAGIMQTGWLELGDSKYYLNEDGTRHTGWLELDGKQYYLKDDGSLTKGKLVIDGEANYFTSTGAKVVLVNTWNALPDDFEPELVKWSNGALVGVECSEALEQMLDDCTAAGCSPEFKGSYRDIGHQRNLFNQILKEYRDKGYGDAYARTLKRCAIPGTSEHHLGLAFDLTDRRYPQKYTGENNAVQWLSENCWEYGFILRYPEDKTDITGIMGEPWHFRYVGVELAMELKDSGLCLEEYLDNLTNDGTTCGNPNYVKEEPEETEPVKDVG